MATLAMMALAAETWGDKLAQEQEGLMALSDLIVDTFLADSAALRATQAMADGHPLAAVHTDAATVIAHDGCARSEATARTLVASMQTGENLRTSLAGLRRLFDVDPVDTVAARRRIADATSARKAYPFGARS
jgi:hypothetical protein